MRYRWGGGRRKNAQASGSGFGLGALLCIQGLGLFTGAMPVARRRNTIGENNAKVPSGKIVAMQQP